MVVTAIFICLIATLAAALVYLINRNLNYWKDRGIPHDKPSLIVGNMHGAARTGSFHQFYKELYMKYKGSGPFAGFHLFSQPAVLILETSLIKNIMIKDFSNFVDRGLYHNERDDPLSANLFFVDGEKWRYLRNKLSPAFTSGKMKFMYPTLLNVADRLTEAFTDSIQKDSIVEVKEIMSRYTTDVIGSCVFGIACNSMKDPNAEFRKIGIRSVKFRHNGLISGLAMALPKIARLFGICMTPQDVHNFFMRIIRETVEYRERNGILHSKDLLNLMMELRKVDKHDKSDGLTIEQIAAQAFIFFVGGFESSATTLSFMLYELAQHPEMQDKLREEINDRLLKHKKFTYESMQDMPYMGQVFNETLRKYSVLQALGRKALKDYIVPGHPNYVIKAGMQVVIPVSAIHHDPEIYPDPDKFNPERFTPEMVQKRESSEFLAFGDGPRNCIGLRFGKIQSIVGMAHLLKRFKFSTCAKTEIPIIMDAKSLTVSPKNGIFLKAEII